MFKRKLLNDLDCFGLKKQKRKKKEQIMLDEEVMFLFRIFGFSVVFFVRNFKSNFMLSILSNML